MCWLSRVQVSAGLYWTIVCSSSRTAPRSPPIPSPWQQETECHQGWRAAGSGAHPSKRCPREGSDPGGQHPSCPHRSPAAAPRRGDAGSCPCLKRPAALPCARLLSGACRLVGDGSPGVGCRLSAPYLLYLFLIVGEAGRNCRLCFASSCRGEGSQRLLPTSLGLHPKRTWNALRLWQGLAGQQCRSRSPPVPAARTRCSACCCPVASPSCSWPSPGAPCPGSSSQAWGWASRRKNPLPPSPKMKSRWDTRSHPPL